MIITFRCKRMDFSAWLLQEMNKRGWSHADMARAAGMSPGGVTNIINRVRQPSTETCRKLAKALNVSPETVLQAAGILPRRTIKSVLVDQAATLLEQLDEDDQEHIVRMIEAYVMSVHKRSAT